MSRYIDADALLNEVERYFVGLPISVHHDMVEYIENAPTVDMGEKFIEDITNRISERLIQFLEANYEITPKKPAVRCKDCKHLVRSEGVCKVLSNNYEPPVYVEDDDFCSRGERREDD